MVTKKEPMIESDRMTQQEEEEKAKEKHPNKSQRISLEDFIPDLPSSNSTWKSAEPINDHLRKFRNYQI